MAPFHKLLDKVTGEGLLDTDWDGNLRCVDLVRQKDVTPKDAIKSIKKRMVHKNPNVALHALVLLEMVVKNCGQPIHKEVATAPFMKDFRGLIEGSPRGVKVKALEMIQTWGLAFRDQPGFRVIPDTYNILRMEVRPFFLLLSSSSSQVSSPLLFYLFGSTPIFPTVRPYLYYSRNPSRNAPLHTHVLLTVCTHSSNDDVQIYIYIYIIILFI